VFFEYIRQALQEIKATGPVSTAETAAGKSPEDSKETGKDESRKKGEIVFFTYIFFFYAYSLFLRFMVGGVA